MSNKPLCVMQIPLFSRSGYGEWATDLAKSILRDGRYELAIANTRWGGCPTQNITDENATAEDKELLNRILKAPLTKQPELFVQCSIPSEFQPIGKYNIGFTAGIEVDKASAAFVQGLNRMNLNVVMSNFSKKVFEDSKMMIQHQDGRQEPLEMNKPMEICPWGVNTNIFKKTDEQSPAIEDVMSKIPETFGFLFVGQWTHGGTYNDRKDIGMLIKTFCNAFKNTSTPPCLILKTSGVNFSITDRTNILTKIKEVTDSIADGKCPNVYLIHGELTQKEMNSLYNHDKVKVVCSFSHGEGWGQSLLQASMAGKYIMASNWAGHLDFLNPKYCTLLEGKVGLIDPSSVNEWLIKEGAWFTVSYSMAEERIRNIFFNYTDKVKEKAESLRLENMEKFSLPAMDKILSGILDKHVPQFSIEQKIQLPKLKKIQLPQLKKIELPKNT